MKKTQRAMSTKKPPKKGTNQLFTNIPHTHTQRSAIDRFSFHNVQPSAACGNTKIIESKEDPYHHVDKISIIRTIYILYYL